MSYNSVLNARLVEEFGSLERICNDMYGAKHGVTCYIDEMAGQNARGRREVPDWSCCLSSLRRVRHKRNSLSHGEVSFDDECADEDDIDFIDGFKNLLLSGRDPLALLDRHGRRRARGEDDSRESLPETLLRRETDDREEDDSHLTGCALGLVAAFLVFLVFYLLLSR